MPLLRRFPALAALPRAALGSFPTPVERISAGEGMPLGGALWIKRDDLSASPLGGNKVRALEFLLGGVGPGDEVLTVGSVGSTHALTTALYARRLGARTTVLRWPQEMNPDATRVAERLPTLADLAILVRHPVLALVHAQLRRLGPRVHWVPPGGTSPLGILGHVNAALELAEQVAGGECPIPGRIYVPLGTGGTAAGIALGLAIAGLDVPLVAVRVVPRLVANQRRVLALAASTRRLILRHAGTPVARVTASRVTVVHDAYGGAYGRPTAAALTAAAWLHASLGIAADATYSAKALGAVLASPASDAPSLFWMTYDPRACAP